MEEQKIESESEHRSLSYFKYNVKRKRERLSLKNSELIPVLSRERRHSKEELESVKLSLKPVYSSFPRLQHSSLYQFKFSLPKYGSINSGIDHNLNINSYLYSIAISWNYLLGYGVVGFPFIYLKTGWTSLVQLIVVGIACNKTTDLLRHIQYIFALESYPEIAEEAIGYKGRLLTTLIFYFQLLLGIHCGYFNTLLSLS